MYDRMLRYKRIFVEPRDKLQFTKVFSDYRTAAAITPMSANDIHGAALFAVMRGRASEGMDLADYAGRGVAILGLPYPPFMDPRVKLKMAYLDEQHTEIMNWNSSKTNTCEIPLASHPTGRKWYNMQAWRAVNQSVGRVIRHHRDFGAVFLCDARFAAPAAKCQLPKWMQSSLYTYDEVHVAVKETDTFYKSARIKYTALEGSSQNKAGSYNLDSSKRFNLTNQSGKHENEITATAASLKSLLGEIRMANQYEILSDSQDVDSNEDEALTKKLMQAKRLRVTHSSNSSETSAVRFSKAVRTYFQSSQPPSQSSDSLLRFKQALQAYKATVSEAGTSQNSASTECVDNLFAQLKSLFYSENAQKLLKGKFDCMRDHVVRQPSYPSSVLLAELDRI
ncbi:unnamed protein product [Echinostoma caproni]|uniref:HELICc2 domain-containing protein n=1 Tax=Echinostoma caproni TaxID=27848 RepID=A0A183AEP8_9TREM|nr:unnamed protein product [Echinostoma caproni]